MVTASEIKLPICCGKMVECELASKYHKNTYPSSVILICKKCQKQTMPCYSTLGYQSVMDLLIEYWNELI